MEDRIENVTTSCPIIGLIVATICLMIAPLSFAGEIVPNTFSAGDTVSASRMNQNFEALESAVEGGISDIIITIRENGSAYNTESWVVSQLYTAQCSAGELLTGGMCTPTHTDQNFENTNIGFIGSCKITSTSVSGFTTAYYEFHDDSNYGPPITVQAICARAVTVGSTPIITPRAVVDTQTPLTEEDEAAIELIRDQAFQYQQIFESKLAE